MCFARICKSCIWKNICAADLRILCTTVFRTFADLHIYILHLCRKLRNMFCVCAEISEHVENILRMCANMKFTFSQIAQGFQLFEQNRQNLRKSWNFENVRFCPVGFWRVPENVRKKLTCSWVVHEWFLGQRFDNTGWQKSPEYALIRIAAGRQIWPNRQIRPRTAPGAPEKSPLFPPDGKAPGFGARARFCSPGWNPFRRCFPDPRTTRPSRQTIPRRVEFCDRVRHILQMCAHFAKHSLKTAVRANDIPAHRAHRAHRNTTVHTCAHRATTPDTSGREHIVHVLLLLGGGRWRSVHEQ